ncbi:hypothetical protein C7271_00480 [filamentous cyanobacterium CCP5]|nr:hypothetical protein C7271_00480 [filamentous cyanobacterium CCP5]
MILNPDYPHIVWSFTYRGWRLEIDQSAEEGQTLYAVWANHEAGCAVAVPCAFTQSEAIKRAKRYVDVRMNTPAIKIV